MSLLFHQFRKDFRQTFAAFAAFIAALGFNACCSTLFEDFRFFPAIDQSFRAALHGLSWNIHYVMEFVLVCRIIHADCLTGATAFWMSRPISRSFLFGSKALGIAILVGIPIYFFRLVSGQIVPVSAEFGFLGFCVLLAAMTSTLVRAIAAAVAVWISYLIAIFLVTSATPQTPPPEWLAKSLFFGIFISTWILVVALCFFSRRRVIPWAITLASPLLAALLFCLLDGGP